MFDIALRPLKDSIFNSVCRGVPAAVTPLHITALAFVAGVASCIAAAYNLATLAVLLWALNRILDCLDGAVARHRNASSDLGGFLDLLSDFIIYSATPVCCALGISTVEPYTTVGSVQKLWLSVAFTEATFHINNFVLFFIAALLEKRKATAALESAAKASKSTSPDISGQEDPAVKELTSVAMKPALIEGAESGLIFTIMFAAPHLTESLCWILGGAVVIGIGQRVDWTVHALRVVA